MQNQGGIFVKESQQFSSRLFNPSLSQNFTKACLVAISSISLLACQGTSPLAANNQPSGALRAQNTAAESVRTGFDAYQVVHKVNGKLWPSMELLRTAGLPLEPMLDRGRQRDPDVLSCFGTELPPSTDVCLHDAGAPAKLASTIPVLLIHGANVNASSNWASPPYAENKPGMMQHLREQGFRVFAVSFANKHGDNFVWMNQIHNAIARIKTITGAPAVDAIGHSKGGFPNLSS